MLSSISEALLLLMLSFCFKRRVIFFFVAVVPHTGSPFFYFFQAMVTHTFRMLLLKALMEAPDM